MSSATCRSSPETPTAASSAVSRSSILSDMKPPGRALARAYSAAVKLELPEPYDFHRSTFRYRTFGADAANVWHEEALFRVLRSGLVVRISAAGVSASAEPAAADRAELLHTLG